MVLTVDSLKNSNGLTLPLMVDQAIIDWTCPLGLNILTRVKSLNYLFGEDELGCSKVDCANVNVIHIRGRPSDERERSFPCKRDEYHLTSLWRPRQKKTSPLSP